MKKFKWLSAAVGLTLFLTACGGNESETSEDPAAETPEETPAEESETKGSEKANSDKVTAEEVMVKSADKMAEANSYHIDMNMEQTMKRGEESLDVNTNLVMDVTEDPMTFKQIMTMPNPDTGEEMEIEQYMDEDGTIYMYEPNMKQWLSMSGESIGLSDAQDLKMSSEEQFALLQKASENIEMEEEGEHYKLTLEGSGEELKDIASAFSTMDMDPQMQSEMEEMMSSLNIENLTYVMYINKETYYQEEFEMQTDMAVEQEGGTLTFSQVANGKFSKHGEIDNIEIPQEALDQAVNIDEEMNDLEGLEMEENAAS